MSRGFLFKFNSMSWNINAFIEKLENNHDFPGQYTFKFIVKPEQRGKVEQLVPNAKVAVKPSSGNKYVSVTLNAMMVSSKDVVEVYKEAQKIEGIIAL